MNALQPEFKKRIEQITELSKKVNNDDREKILDMIYDHVTEIAELYEGEDEHWTIETADLIVLCLELLLMENKDIDEVFTKCLPRFDSKLQQLAVERNIR